MLLQEGGCDLGTYRHLNRSLNYVSLPLRESQQYDLSRWFPSTVMLFLERSEIQKSRWRLPVGYLCRGGSSLNYFYVILPKKREKILSLLFLYNFLHFGAELWWTWLVETYLSYSSYAQYSVYLSPSLLLHLLLVFIAKLINLFEGYCSWGKIYIFFLYIDFIKKIFLHGSMIGLEVSWIHRSILIKVKGHFIFERIAPPPWELF